MDGKIQRRTIAKLVTKWLLVCCMPLFSVTAAGSDQTIVTQLSQEKLQDVLDKTRWSIIRSKIQGDAQPVDDSVKRKSYSVRKRAIRLSHRKISSLQDYEKKHILAPVNFLQSHFVVSPQWTLAKLDAVANFSSAKFDQRIDFKWVIFKDLTYFTYATFAQQASFYGTFFSKMTDFYRAKFYGYANFDTAHFGDNLGFSHVKFSGEADFTGVKFDADVDFSHSYFAKSVNFAAARFGGELDLRDATFAESLDFSRAEFAGRVITSEMMLPKFLDFSNVVKSTYPIDLTGVKRPASQAKCWLNLVGANISLMKFRYEPFQLYFPERTSHEEIVRVYEATLKMLQDNGFKDSYREVMIEYKKHTYQVANQQFTNWVQAYGWDYGFDPERIFFWILVVLLFFTSINALFYRKLVENVMDVPFLSRHAESEFIERHFLLRYIFYFPLTFIYTLLILFSHLLGFKRDFTDFKSKSLLVNTYIVILLLVGITCSLFILNYLLGGTSLWLSQ
jgi:uncharacterized protein YjbI with pentapeptide repeats